jgi:RecJ-like exonuclease
VLQHHLIKNIKKIKKKKTIICPNCRYNGPVDVMLNDGGNYECPGCGSPVHKCINGYIISRQGPAFCKYCKDHNLDEILNMAADIKNSVIPVNN